MDFLLLCDAVKLQNRWKWINAMDGFMIGFCWVLDNIRTCINSLPVRVFFPEDVEAGQLNRATAI